MNKAYGMYIAWMLGTLFVISTILNIILWKTITNISCEKSLCKNNYQ